MTIAELLGELSSRGVKLRVEGDQLRVSAPRGVLTPEIASRLKRNKVAILARLGTVAEDRDRRGAAVEPILPRARDGALPLSLSQERLWFMNSLTGGTTFLNLPIGFTLHGPLNLRLLEETLRHIVDCHEALRTVFRMGSEGPEQIVVPHVEIKLDVIDISGEPNADDPETWQARLAPEVGKPIPIATVPLFRTGVFRVSPEKHVFYFMSSHLIWDGWSSDVFVRDLRQTYESLASGTRPPGPLPIQYGDYVLWHRDWLAAQTRRDALEYWKQKLAGAQTTLELPYDRPRPPHMSYRGAALTFEIPQSLVERVRTLARQRGATLYMVMLTALNVLLHRYTGQKDIVVGAPVDGRLRPETEDLIGLFVNTLVLRTELHPEESFVSLLEKVRETCVEAYDHQHTPFEQLVEALRPVRDRSRTPLFQVMFSYHQVRDGGTRMGSVTLEQFPLHSGSTGTDATYWVRDDGSRIVGAFEYSVDLFERETIARLSDAMMDLLDAVTSHPHRAIQELPLSPRHEKTLDAWNSTKAAYDREHLVHRLFEAWVDTAPDRTALVFEDRRVSYSELDEWASRIARRLRQLGVGPDVRVGVCLPRSIDLVATLIGVQKAGGCYVPLDPTYPAARLEMMLEDSGARVLVVNADTREVFPSHGVRHLDLDLDRSALQAVSGARLHHDESSSQLAYVIYTSGSTGKPKGVLVEHRNVVNFFRGMEDVIAFDADGVWLAGTSISFDISVLEIFGSLTHGLTVVLLGEQRLGATTSEEYGIQQSIERHRVTHFQCTPSQAGILLLDPAARASFARLRQFLVGGEALPLALSRDLRAALKNGDLVNMYGPTETTVWSTTHVVTEASGSVPIGRPIANTVCYVLDANGKHLPIGAVGELYIGGDGVVRGYHQRPDLTEQRFLPDPFRGPPYRMYRTGDLVRYRADGLLEYRGRNDFQVKIRGHRIELGEIETLLEDQPSVGGAAVIAIEEGAGDVRLVAYVVPAPGAEPQPDELRDLLKEKLPAYMVPALFVALAEFPLTPNGKIDRKALPKPEAGAAAADRCHVEPADDVERSIAQMWAEALGVASVGTDDDFFDLGGHSLLGVRILTRIHQQYGVGLSLAVLFDAPTVAALARVVRAELAPAGKSDALVRNEWSSVVPIQPHGSLPPFFCIAGMGGNPMNLRHVAAALGEDQPFFGLQHRGVDGKLEPHQSVESMAREFLGHIRQVQPTGPYFIGGFSGGGVAAFELAHQLMHAGEPVGALVLLEAINPELSWTFAARIEYHLTQLKDDGVRYVAKAMSGRVQRKLQQLRLLWKARAAKNNRYEFRNEAVMQAWLRAERQYQPRPYPGEVTLLRSKIRDTVVFDPYNGWRPVITGHLNVVEVDGGHVSFVDGPYAEGTATELRRVLARARASLSTSTAVLDPMREPQGGEVWTLAG